MSRVPGIRAELETVGADEFCRRRVYREDMPLKLMRALGNADVMDDWNIERVRSPGSTMTDRRRQVLALVADGLGDKEIAAKLGLSVETVKTHVRAVLGLLRARNRTHAVHVAHQQQLL